jgi:iron complex outermembrane receptor protein
MQDSYATTDVRLIWRSEDDHWSAEAFVNNVSDQLRATSVEVTNGGFFGNINPPETWGVRVGYNY